MTGGEYVAAVVAMAAAAMLEGRATGEEKNTLCGNGNVVTGDR